MPDTPSAAQSVLEFVRHRWLPLLLIILTATFVAQNRDRPSIDLFFLSVSPPQWIVMTILFVVGWAVGAFITPRGKR